MSSKKFDFSLRVQVVLLFVFALALLGFVAVFVAPRFASRFQLPAVLKSPTQPAAVRASLVLEPGSGSLRAGQSLPVSVKIKFDQKQSLRGFSFRLKVPVSQGGVLSIKDANPSQQGTQLKVGQEMVESGWIFPVNEAAFPVGGGEVHLDLNGAWVGTGEPPAAKEYTLATFEVSASAASNYQFSFDPGSSMTAIFVADQPQVSLDLGQAKFSFK